jgi:hypothetical protein
MVPGQQETRRKQEATVPPEVRAISGCGDKTTLAMTELRARILDGRFPRAPNCDRMKSPFSWFFPGFLCAKP